MVKCLNPQCSYTSPKSLEEIPTCPRCDQEMFSEPKPKDEE